MLKNQALLWKLSSTMVVLEVCAFGVGVDVQIDKLKC